MPGVKSDQTMTKTKVQVMRNNSVCDTEVSGLKTTYRDRIFDWYRTHRHRTTHSKQGSKTARPLTRTNARKHALQTLCTTRAEHLGSTKRP